MTIASLKSGIHAERVLRELLRGGVVLLDALHLGVARGEARRVLASCRACRSRNVSASPGWPELASDSAYGAHRELVLRRVAEKRAPVRLLRARGVAETLDARRRASTAARATSGRPPAASWNFFFAVWRSPLQPGLPALFVAAPRAVPA